MLKGHPPICFQLDPSHHLGPVNFLQYTVYCQRALILKIYINLSLNSKPLAQSCMH